MRIRLSEYIAIQAVPSDWLMWPPVGNGALRSKMPMLSRPEETALEDVAALGVLAIDPPGEIQHQLVEDALEKGAVAVAATVAVDLDRPARRPRHALAD